MNLYLIHSFIFRSKFRKKSPDFLKRLATYQCLICIVTYFKYFKNLFLLMLRTELFLRDCKILPH